MEQYNKKYYEPYRTVNDDNYLLDEKPEMPEMVEALNIPQPLKFFPLLSPRLWGGNKLATILQKKLPKNEAIGESWEISGYKNSISVVNHGGLQGVNLNFIMNIWGQDMLGKNIEPAPENQFPLLAKFLDANDFLSVQVHPEDKKDEQGNIVKFGKVEAWYILDADKDAFIYQGFSKNTTPQEVQSRIENKTLPEILNKIAIKPGDTIVNPAKTIHAIGPNILLFEIQQVSDCTYRLYDFERKTRELHIEQGLENLFYDSGLPQTQTPSTHLTGSLTKLANTEYFTMFLIDIDKDRKVNLEGLPDDRMILLHCIAGDFEISTLTLGVNLTKGESCLIPAFCMPFSIRSGSGKIIAVTP